MSSRTRVLQTITLTLLLFGQCWSLWIRSPDTLNGEDSLLDNSNINNEFLNGNEVERQQQQQQLLYHHSPRDVIGPEWTQQQERRQEQLVRFLQENAAEQRLHAVTSNLRHLLKENSDDNLPIVYEEDNGLDQEVEEEEEAPQQMHKEYFDWDRDQQSGGIEENIEEPEEAVVEYDINENGEVTLNKNKRSGRYYRRYPFKRRNNRYYETPKHNCKPSREEVVKLLIALHKYQNGNKERKMVRFCKRDRPLGNIITNMRFLG